MLWILMIDMTNTVQVAIIVRSIDSDFIISEEMASLLSLKDTTKIRNLFGSSKNYIEFGQYIRIIYR